MSGKTIIQLQEIFKRHQNERICVVGTMCCGKTTLIKELSDFNCVDVDDVFWPLISQKQIEIFSRIPITKEIFTEICRLMKEKIKVKPGFPLFGVVVLECEVVVYLDISDKLLEEHCLNRKDTRIEDALSIKRWIEADCSDHQARKDKTFYHLFVQE